MKRRDPLVAAHPIPITHCILLAVAVLTMGLSLAAQIGRLDDRVDVLTHFAPLYLALGLATGAVSAIGWSDVRGPVVACSLVTVASCLVLLSPEFLRPPGHAPPPGTERLTIVQFNAWGQNRETPKAIAWILAQSPDFVILQEASVLSDALVRKEGWTRTCEACAVTILAKTSVVAISDTGSRYVTSATFRDGGGEFSVIGVHRFWPTKVTAVAEQRRIIGELIARAGADRTILAGDFNSTPWSFVRQREDRAFGLERRTRALPTWPADRLSHYRLPAPFPFLPIDHVFAGDGWATIDVRRGPRLGSDHYPVVVTLARR